jgi:hypothetical protein
MIRSESGGQAVTRVLITSGIEASRRTQLPSLVCCGRASGQVWTVRGDNCGEKTSTVALETRLRGYLGGFLGRMGHEDAGRDGICKCDFADERGAVGGEVVGFLLLIEGTIWPCGDDDGTGIEFFGAVLGHGIAGEATTGMFGEEAFGEAADFFEVAESLAFG